MDPLELELFGQHGFPCGLWHPPPRWLEAAVLHRPLAGIVDHPPEWGFRPGPLLQPPELFVGAARPWLWAEEWVWVSVVSSWGLLAVAGPGVSS